MKNRRPDRQCRSESTPARGAFPGRRSVVPHWDATWKHCCKDEAIGMSETPCPEAGKLQCHASRKKKKKKNMWNMVVMASFTRSVGHLATGYQLSFNNLYSIAHSGRPLFHGLFRWRGRRWRDST